MTINDRINWVIQDKGLKQKDIAEKILISRAAVSKICSGTNPSTQTVSLFCQEFNVNRDWLENGVGEPYVSYSREKEIADIVGTLYKLDDESFKFKLISALAGMDEDRLKMFETFIAGVMANK